MVIREKVTELEPSLKQVHTHGDRSRKMSDLVFPRSVGTGDRWQADVVDAIYTNGWKQESSTHLYDFSRYFSASTNSERDRHYMDMLLNQLGYRDISDRQDRIAQAHQRTFQWLFDRVPSSDQPWSSLVEWFEGPSQLYWITGKPGSGKSTLMKYLYQNPRTFELLNKWAGRKALITSSFYFWNSGSQVQMSQLGFIRSILHTILKQQPQLVPHVLPDRWKTSRLLGEDLRPWTSSELRRGFNSLIEQSSDSFQLCLFVDGLDEAEGYVISESFFPFGVFTGLVQRVTRL